MLKLAYEVGVKLALAEAGVLASDDAFYKDAAWWDAIMRLFGKGVGQAAAKAGAGTAARAGAGAATKAAPGLAKQMQSWMVPGPFGTLSSGAASEAAGAKVVQPSLAQRMLAPKRPMSA